MFNYKIKALSVIKIKHYKSEINSSLPQMLIMQGWVGRKMRVEWEILVQAWLVPMYYVFITEPVFNINTVTYTIYYYTTDLHLLYLLLHYTIKYIVQIMFVKLYFKFFPVFFLWFYMSYTYLLEVQLFLNIWQTYNVHPRCKKQLQLLVAF